MVAPTTGPFTRTETALGPTNPWGYTRSTDVVQTRIWKRQRRPYNLPLDFTFQRSAVVKRVYHPDAITSYWSSSDDGHAYPAHSSSSFYPEVYNKAFNRFKGKLAAETAGGAVNFAQRKQAIEMIAMRAGQLTSAVRHLSRGRFGLAANAFGLVDPPKGWKKKGKALGDQFLEAHFGWEPLVKDIGAAVEILQGGVPPVRVIASAKGQGSYSDNTPTSSDPIYYRTWKDSVVWQIGTDVIVSNPNLWLANQLGFVNPALVAWDLIPFSFVLNWFVSVEEFLSGFTDFWGLTLSNSWTTSYLIRDTKKWQVVKTWPGHPANTVYRTYDFHRVQAIRQVGGIPTPSLLIRQPWRLSPTRGLTAVSLLLQQLGASRGKP